MGEDEEEGLTYAEAGVDIAASEAATAALLDAASRDQDDTYAGVLEIDDLHLGLTTDGVGTKILVAEAVGRYDSIGIDCIAMNVNDLVAEGIRPVGFVDYLALEEPDETLTAEIGRGLATGAEMADVSLMGGETAILPEVITGVDLAGAALGVGTPTSRPRGSAVEGDVMVGFASSGIHSNGLTLARRAIEREHDYDDPYPEDPSRTIGEVLLEPTRLYTDLYEVFERFDVHAGAHITGGGLRNLFRMGTFRYVLDDHPSVPSVFDLVQRYGDVSDEEMYGTFNMGLGFVLAVDPEVADEVVAETEGMVIGRVESGAMVEVAGLELEPSS